VDRGSKKDSEKEKGYIWGEEGNKTVYEKRRGAERARRRKLFVKATKEIIADLVRGSS
jgi:hypothetical protein